MEVIVVDNGSTDGTPEWVQARFPRATLVRNERNRGVAPARNQGLRIAGGKYCLLLDVDTVLGDGALSALVGFLDANSSAGLVGPKLVDPDGRLQFTCRRFPTVLSKVARRAPGRWSGALLEEEEFRRWDHGSPAAVDYVIGACQLLRRSALDEVGLLDERIFYGPEDVDLCLRMWEHGWQVWYVPGASVIHWEQRVTRRLPSLLAIRHMVALGYFFAKHRYFWSREGLYRRLDLPPTREIPEMTHPGSTA